MIYFSTRIISYIDSPTNVQELKDGAGNLWEDIGDTWDEWDLGNMTDVLDGLDDLSFGGLFNEDPKLGNNQTTRWKSDYIKDDGLHLTLYNALDDTWQSEYSDAIADWQQSDALQLTTQRVAVDYECTRVDGVMVVCNANFGATGWVGINENSISSRGVILSSVSKMNEYYLRNADYNHRRFTMCHEVGHGKFVFVLLWCGIVDCELSLCFMPFMCSHRMSPPLFRTWPSTYR